MNVLADRTSLVFQAGGPLAYVLAGLAVVLVAVIGARSVQNLSGRRTAVLVALRIALAVLVVLLALRPVMPVELTPRTGWSSAEVSASLSAAAARHPILRLGWDDRAASVVVADLLPVRGLSIGLVPDADAHVLLETDDAERHPLLIVGEAGEGRAMVLATDSSWRWSLPMVGRGRSPRGYERFWENAIRWLVRDPRSALVVLDTDRRTVESGESTELRVRVTSESYEPSPHVAATVRIVDAWGEEVSEEMLVTGEDAAQPRTGSPPADAPRASVPGCALPDPGGMVGRIEGPRCAPPSPSRPCSSAAPSPRRSRALRRRRTARCATGRSR